MLICNWNTVLTLCKEASLGELNLLVHDLHRRRQKTGLTLWDYAAQNRLKALIYLVYFCGNLQKEERVNYKLLQALKNVSRKLKTAEPQGLLRRILEHLTLSWPELLTLFGSLIAKPAVWEFLGSEMAAQVTEYVRFNNLLYLLLTKRILTAKKGTYAISGGEVAELVGEDKVEPYFLHNKKTPLLPLPNGSVIASPELLYDSLLQSYVDLLTMVHKQVEL